MEFPHHECRNLFRALNKFPHSLNVEICKCCRSFGSHYNFFREHCKLSCLTRGEIYKDCRSYASQCDFFPRAMQFSALNECMSLLRAPNKFLHSLSGNFLRTVTHLEGIVTFPREQCKFPCSMSLEICLELLTNFRTA